MMHRWSARYLSVVSLLLACCLQAQGKEMKDTLSSTSGDRIIVSYSVSQNDGQLTIAFNNVLKRLSQTNQREYGTDLSKIAVVFFDRIGTYGNTRFEGMQTSSFMVPANMSYSRSDDGFFLLQDNPVLRLTVTGNEETQLSIPLFLAYYRRSGRYEVFSQCGPLVVNSTAGRSAATRGGRSGRGGGAQGAGGEVITTEEIVDEGLAPADDALITIANLRDKLASASRLPFSEDLVFQANHLRELRSKVSDLDVQRQINQVLDAYDQKKAELEEQQTAQQQASAAAQQEEAQRQQAAQQARQDSIQAAQEQKAADDKKDMMWLIGGIAGLGLLVMGAKQIFQTIKNNKMQRMMMDNLNKAQQQMVGNVKIPGVDANNPLMREVNQQLQRDARKTLTKEGEAAKQRLQALRKGNTNTAQQAGQWSGNAGAAPTRPANGRAASPSTPDAAGSQPAAKRPSLNDQIPARYKRWKKPGQSNNNNVTI